MGHCFLPSRICFPSCFQTLSTRLVWLFGVFFGCLFGTLFPSISHLFSKLLSNVLHEAGVAFWCLLWEPFWDTFSFRFAYFGFKGSCACLALPLLMPCCLRPVLPCERASEGVSHHDATRRPAPPVMAAGRARACPASGDSGFLRTGVVLSFSHCSA